MPAQRSDATVSPLALLPQPRRPLDPGPVADQVFAAWAEADPDCLLVVQGPDLRLAWANRAAAATLTCDGDLVGKPLLALLADGSALRPQDVVDASNARHVEVVVPCRDGGLRSAVAHSVPVAGGWVVRLAVTDRARASDDLTGLVNRRGLLAALSSHVPATPPGRALLLLLDLDDFKLVNDGLGHEHGDALLVDVARRLVGTVRDGDVVSRFGGDEFAVLCTDVEDEVHAADLATRVLAAVTGPLLLGGAAVRVTASLGVVVVGAGHHEAEDVLRDADVAMYQAKSAGKDRWVLFDDAAREQHRRRHELVTDLRRALERGELSVAYQPVVALQEQVSGAPYAVEALARWDHPTRGPVSPQEFVALAEGNGLIGALSAHVLRAACAQLASWQRQYGDQAPSRVCVNVSPLQLRQAGFVDEVASVLSETGLSGSSLCLELTESAVMEDPALAAASFAALRALGVTVAIDDFGTGYSSLALLRTLPVDLLKVDRSFLAELEQDGSARVVAAVVGLGAVLGLDVVAEGVETVAQMTELVRLGCPRAQGYLFSRPLTPLQVEDLADAGWPW